MTTETFTIDFDANTQPIETKLAALADRANAFSGAISIAFKDAVVGGKSFDSILSSLILRLSSTALEKALTPLSNLIGNLFGGIFGLGNGAAAAGCAAKSFAAPGFFSAPAAVAAKAPGGATSAAAPTVVNFAITTADADSFRKSEAQVTAMLARAVGRGRRGL